MGIFRSKPKSPQLSETDATLLEIKRQRDRLLKYQQQLTSRIEAEKTVIQQLLKQGKKKQALLALRKQKQQQQQQEQTSNILFNLESLVLNIEEAIHNKQVFEVLEKGKVTLQKMNEELSVDRVADLMEDTQEAIEYQEQLSQQLATAFSPEQEADIQQQLQQMEEELLAEQVSTLPTAPKDKVVFAEKKEEKPKEEEKQQQQEQQQEEATAAAMASSKQKQKQAVVVS